MPKIEKQCLLLNNAFVKKPKTPTNIKNFEEEEKTSRQIFLENVGPDVFFFFKKFHFRGCFWFF